jgi:hypothetical protein
MKEIILTSAVLFSVMLVLIALSSLSVMAQETPLGTDTNNMTGTDINNMTGTDINETAEPDAGMISRKD